MFMMLYQKNSSSRGVGRVMGGFPEIGFVCEVSLCLDES